MKGLYNKYKIEKKDGSLVDVDAQYFVLRLDTDRAARVAVLTYAIEIANTNPALSRDIHRLVASLDKRR